MRKEGRVAENSAKVRAPAPPPLPAGPVATPTSPLSPVPSGIAAPAASSAAASAPIVVDPAAPISVKIHAALARLTGAALGKEAVLSALSAVFGAGLHAASQSPEFAEALLEEIRGRQSPPWKTATQIKPAKIFGAGKTGDKAIEAASIRSKIAQNWYIRHYTNKFEVVLGPETAPGSKIYAVNSIQQPPYRTLLSNISLATLPVSPAAPPTAAAAAAQPPHSVMMSFSKQAGISGHTTGDDWKNIGNVGDTFFGLFSGIITSTRTRPNSSRMAFITRFGRSRN